MSNGIFDMLKAPFTSATVPVIVFPDCLFIIEIVAYSSGSLVDLSNTLPEIMVLGFDWALTAMLKKT